MLNGDRNGDGIASEVEGKPEEQEVTETKGKNVSRGGNSQHSGMLLRGQR